MDESRIERDAAAPPTIRIPELALVVLVGPSGCGKSTFAGTHFGPFETLSSDYCRGLVSNDENDQSATKPAFEALHFLAAKRLERGLLTVVDATNVQVEARKPLVELARRYHVVPCAIVFDLPVSVCQARNKDRADRAFGPHVIRQQHSQLRRSLRMLQREGFRHVSMLRSEAEVARAAVVREPLWNNRKSDHGPFDIIGDVHGCCDELDELLAALGYAKDAASGWVHPDARKAVFVGDLVDRGPRIPEVLRTVMAMVAGGSALAVPGNHDMKLVRRLRGRDVQITHGLAESLAQLEQETPEFREHVATFLDDLVSHYVLDDAHLVVAHAGMKAEMQGRGSGKVRDFALYGETTGETDEFGLPVRYDWAAEYRGAAHVVYGHTPVPDAQWLNRTINIDTGCVFGGRLTALRWPEKELVSVRARATYATPARPLVPTDGASASLAAQQREDDVLDVSDVLGKRIIETGLHHTVTIREENATPALEVMSRFAANPKWLVYLPPTMSPSETTNEPGYLEYPTEAFAYFRNAGVPAVICEEKHMGSRAVVVVCRDAAAAQRRFGVLERARGIIYTRTGRRFFGPAEGFEAELLDIIATAMERSGFWEQLSTDWVVLDCELMPWSAKAEGLIGEQYAAVSTAASAALPQALAALAAAAARGVPLGDVRQRFETRAVLVRQYGEAWQRYCWPVASVHDLRLAPFHVLATEGALHTDKDHRWHIDTAQRICAADRTGVLFATPHRVVDLSDPVSERDATAWWVEVTAHGGEGMVVKPLTFVATGRRGLLQPAVKCRGREYLRIIYGPDYTLRENLERLRARGLGAKRSLALREFALGIEGLDRFVRREPLRRVHECAFGVLALETEPVDPRL